MIDRTIVISDIHGCLDTFNQLLKLVQYAPDRDRLVLLGDYVDRGPRSKDVVEQVLHMTSELNVIALRGNHDQRFVDWVLSSDSELHAKFVEHGGIPTLQSYCGTEWSGIEWNEEELQRVKEWIRSRYAAHLELLSALPLFYEDERHIYVHAGLNPAYPQWKEQPQRDFMWIRDAFYNKPTVVDKTVVFGHTLTMEIQDQSGIWFGRDKIGVDGGCAYGMQLNALEIRDKEAYGSYHVPFGGIPPKSRAV